MGKRMDVEQLCCLPSLFIQILCALHIADEGKPTSTFSDLSLFGMRTVIMAFTAQLYSHFPSFYYSSFFMSKCCKTSEQQVPGWTGAEGTSFCVPFACIGQMINM